MRGKTTILITSLHWKNRLPYQRPSIFLIFFPFVMKTAAGFPRRPFLPPNSAFRAWETERCRTSFLPAGIHPKRKMEEVSGTEYRSMYDAVKNVLAEMAAKGGRDTEKDLFARPGGYTTILSKKTLWTPCPRCGYELRKGTYLGGTIYYCEHCQS